MFDACNIPSLEQHDKSSLSMDAKVIYIGAYAKQIYIQTSELVHQQVKQPAIATFIKTIVGYLSLAYQVSLFVLVFLF